MAQRRAGTKIKPGEGRVLALLRRTATARGIFGGSRGWTSVAIGLWGYRRLRRMAGRSEEVVFSGILQPGERLLITNGPETVGEVVPARRRHRR